MVLKAIRAGLVILTMAAFVLGVGALEVDPINYIYILSCIGMALIFVSLGIWVNYITERRTQDAGQ